MTTASLGFGPNLFGQTSTIESVDMSMQSAVARMLQAVEPPFFGGDQAGGRADGIGETSAREIHDEILSSFLYNMMKDESDDETFTFGREIRSVEKLIAETAKYSTLLREFDEIHHRLNQARSSSAQEGFVFDVIAPFIERHGIKALERFDDVLPTLPFSAQYYYPYLLGHMDHSDTHSARMRFLGKYIKSTVEPIREGAEEAIDHVNAA